MKKLLVILVFALVVCLSVSASASSERKSQSASTVGPIGKIIQAVGSKFSTITATVIYAIHPFPNTLADFYNLRMAVKSIDATTNTSADEFNGNKLLTSSGYYEAKENPGTIDNTTGVTLPTLSTGQKTRWSVTAALFAVMFAAEIAFTAVMGYVAPQQEGMSLLKEIGAKAAKTFLLFMIAAALPFLIESVRFGLYSIAKTYLPESEVEMNTMFEMPDVFMTDMSLVVQKMLWEQDAVPLFNSEGSNIVGKFLGRLLAGIVYIVFEFFMAIEIIKAGLHIVMNIIEVYLLLSCVMIMLPFTVFTPSKEFTRGCLSSLFLNLIECFVLCLIVMLIVPACLSVCQSLYDLSRASYFDAVSRVVLEAGWDYKSHPLKAIVNGTEITLDEDQTIKYDISLETVLQADQVYIISSWTWSGTDVLGHPYAGSGSLMTCLFDDEEHAEDVLVYKEGRTYMEWNSISPYYNDALIKSPSYSSPKKNQNIDEYLKSLSEKAISGAVCCVSYAILKHPTKTYWGDPINVTKSDKDNIYISLIKKADCSSANLAKALGIQESLNNNWRAKAMEKIRDEKEWMLQNTEAYESDETYTSAENESLIAQMLVAWVVMYIPCYFVKQSSQITNGLRSGYVGMESFANSMNSMTQAMRTGFTTVANLASKGLKLGNTIHARRSEKTSQANQQSMLSLMQGISDKLPGGDSGSSGGGSGGGGSDGGSGPSGIYGGGGDGI